jgi:hypothetical protein
LLALQPAQRPQLVALERMDARRPTLAAADVEPARGKLDLVPLQIAHFGSPEAMTVRDQDHGGIAMAVSAAFPSRCHQGLNLGCRQVLTRPFNCGIYDGWCRVAACPEIHEKCLAVRRAHTSA